MESLVILVMAAGSSAAVVWWALGQPGGRPKPKEPRKLSVPARLGRIDEDSSPEGFVLLPADGPAPIDGSASIDERPPPALSIIRLALTIAVVATLAVAVLAVLGVVLKSQLDQFFTGL